MTTSGTNAKSRRFKDRHLQWFDLVDRFEAKPSSKHAYDACSVIERVRDDASAFWEEGSAQLKRWRHYCNVLWTFINTGLGERRYVKNQDLAEALREFFQEFEHSTHGMYEMLYGTSDDPENDPKIKQVLDWFPLIFRCSTYTITSFWLDDKTEDVLIDISINSVTGKRSQKTTKLKEMQVPKKHRRAAKDL